MKIEDFAYAVVQKVFWELEHHHHFNVPEPIRKKIQESIRGQINDLIVGERQRAPAKPGGTKA